MPNKYEKWIDFFNLSKPRVGIFTEGGETTPYTDNEILIGDTATGELKRVPFPGGLPGNAGTKEHISVGAGGIGGSVLTTQIFAYVRVFQACTIVSWSLIADPSGSIVVDIWKTNDARPTVSNTITASAKPTLSSDTDARSSTLTGWTTSIAVNDILGFKIDSVTDVTWFVLQLDLNLA